VLDVVREALFSAVMLRMSSIAAEIEQRVTKDQKELALCWGTCSNDVYEHGRYLYCLCCEPSMPCHAPGQLLPCVLHCGCCIFDGSLPGAGFCLLGNCCCCRDLPSSSYYVESATKAADENLSAYVQMIMHPYWEAALPPGVLAADDRTLSGQLTIDEYEDFIPPEAFPFLAALQKRWLEVLAEFEAAVQTAPERYFEWSDDGLYHAEKGWNVFGLVAYGEQMAFNQRLTPLTTQLLSEIPNLNLAAFSTLSPGTHLLPHKEFDGTSEVRCHLGLKTPNGAVLRVQDGEGRSKTKSWVAGEWLCFKGTALHEALNRADEPRTVLLLDFFSRPGNMTQLQSKIPDWLQQEIDNQRNMPFVSSGDSRTGEMQPEASPQPLERVGVVIDEAPNDPADANKIERANQPASTDPPESTSHTAVQSQAASTGDMEPPETQFV